MLYKPCANLLVSTIAKVNQKNRFEIAGFWSHKFYLVTITSMCYDRQRA